MPHVRGHYRRGAGFGWHRVRPHYRRGPGANALIIVGAALLVAFVVLVLAQAR